MAIHSTVSHSFLLDRPLDLRNPLITHWRIQLSLRAAFFVKRITIQTACPDDLESGHRLAFSKKRAAAVWAEIGRDRVAAVSNLLELLQRSGALEGIFVHDNIGRVNGPAQFFAVITMTQGLIYAVRKILCFSGKKFKRDGGNIRLTFITGSPSYDTVALPHKHDPEGMAQKYD